MKTLRWLWKNLEDRAADENQLSSNRRGRNPRKPKRVEKEIIGSGNVNAYFNERRKFEG